MKSVIGFATGLAIVLAAVVAVMIFPQSLTVTEQRLADLGQFRRDFVDKDKSYTPAARQEAERQLQRLENSLSAMDQLTFDLTLSRIAALTDNGHSGGSPSSRSRRHERVDVRFTPFGEDLYVLRVKAENADLLGARLASIDGVAIDKLRPLYRSLDGGTPAWLDRWAPFFLESPPQLRALGVGKEKGTLAPVYGLMKLDGSLVERTFTISPVGADRVSGNASRWMFPARATAEEGNWKTLLDPARAPWALQDPTRPLRVRHDTTLNALIIDMRQATDSDDVKLKDYFRAVEKLVEATKPQHLVLDLRFNGGGDLTQTRDFAERMPSLVKGRLFALTSPWTFSAAISTLGYLKQAAPERVTIIGEPVGDRLMFFAEGKSIVLKYSRESYMTATERHDYRGGCVSFKDCHRSVVRRPIAVKSLDPDIAAPWTIDAYREGRDPALEAVAAVVKAIQPNQ